MTTKIKVKPMEPVGTGKNKYRASYAGNDMFSFELPIRADSFCSAVQTAQEKIRGVQAYTIERIRIVCVVEMGLHIE